MAHGGFSRRLRVISSHCSRGHSGSQIITTIEDSAEAYQAHTPPEIRVKIDLAETNIRVPRHFISNEEVVHPTGWWIPDPGTNRARESQYLNTIDI